MRSLRYLLHPEALIPLLVSEASYRRTITTLPTLPYLTYHQAAGCIVS